MIYQNPQSNGNNLNAMLNCFCKKASDYTWWRCKCSVSDIKWKLKQLAS